MREGLKQRTLGRVVLMRGGSQKLINEKTEAIESGKTSARNSNFFLNFSQHRGGRLPRRSAASIVVGSGGKTGEKRADRMLDQRDQDLLCEDGGPFACTEEGCSAPFVTCDTLAKEREGCNHSFANFWTRTTAAMTGSVASHCPRSCGRCEGAHQGPGVPSCLALSLGRVRAARHHGVRGVHHMLSSLPILVRSARVRQRKSWAVSYTHLTLPTILLV